MSYKSIQILPTINDSDSVWLSWFKDLRSTLGTKKANAVFVRHWSAQNASDSNVNTSNLRKEMEKFGIDINGGFLGESLDFGRQVKGYFGDMFTAGKWLSIGMGVIIVGSFGALMFQFATKSKFRKDAVNLGTSLASRGLIKGKK